jgi:hypothetical protein
MEIDFSSGPVKWTSNNEEHWKRIVKHLKTM